MIEAILFEIIDLLLFALIIVIIIVVAVAGLFVFLKIKKKKKADSELAEDLDDLLSDIDEEEIYSICERQKTYKKMTDKQYDLLMELGMWRLPDYKDIEEWILIEDKDFANQHWVIYIKKGMKPIHKRIMKEIIKGYERKLKVKI